MTPHILAAGSTITIKRSDGRTQQAIVSSIEYDINYVKVEWFENGETKGKEIHFTNITALNPDILICGSSQPFDKFNSVCCNTINDSLVNKNKRKCMSVSQNYRTQSAKPRLTQQGFNTNSSPLNELIVEGKHLQSFKSCRSAVENLSKRKEDSTMKKLNKLEQDRIERRKKQAEVKAEKDEILKKNQKVPFWELQKMISEYQQKIYFKPLSNKDLILDHLIIVAVRKRPLNDADRCKKEMDIITIPDKNTLIVHEPKYKVDLTKYLDNHVFRFDYAFNESCSNEMVYKYTAQPLVKTVFEGGFATCFAYGQTGSGKTYTMSGDVLENHRERGIYALAASDIFKAINSVKYQHLNLAVSCSFFEIYVKKVFDLLNNKKSLKILEDGKQQVQVVGLTEKMVYSVDEVLDLIKQGNEERASGQTSANMHSSRSHAIFQIYLRNMNNPTVVHGKFSLIDLAGNERGADTFSSSRVTRLEGSEINQSLLSLKECIRALGRKGAHLPFRGSKLTQVLRDSFIGTNSKTCMIAMVSPGIGSCENTLNTLRYADRVKELGGGDGHLDKSSENVDNCIVYSPQSITNICHRQQIVEEPSRMQLNETVINDHKELVKKLYKSAKEAEDLLNVEDEETFGQNWNSFIDDMVSYLLKTKI